MATVNLKQNVEEPEEAFKTLETGIQDSTELQTKTNTSSLSEINVK